MRPVKKSPYSVAHKYCVEYVWTRDDGTKKSGCWSELCTSSDQALAHFHTFVQRHGECDVDRKPTRPRLHPDQYRITEFYISFPSETVKNQWERQTIALPHGMYPDLRKRKFAPPPPTTPFPFMDDMPKGQMPAEQPIIAAD